MNSILAVLIGLAAIALFYSLFYYAYRLAFGKNFTQQNFTKKTWITFGILAFIGFLLCVFSLSKNSYVYYWDYGGYWTTSYNYMDTLYQSSSQGIQDLYSSIINSDYNLILPLIISLPLKIFGITFSRYVIINYFMFLIPTAFLAFSLFIKIARRRESSHQIVLPAFLLLATFVLPFRAMLVGYIDIALLIPIFLLFALAIDFDSTAKPNLRKNLVISLLLVVTFLFRRYSAFFVVVFVASLVFVEIARLLSKRKSPKFKVMFKIFFLSFLTIALISLGIMLIFFAPLVFRILSENYSDMYAGYNLSLPEKTLQIIQRFGLIFLALSAFGIFFSFRKKQHRHLVVISICCFFLTIALFFRVQRMDIHHIYTIITPIAILSFLGLYYIFSFKHKLPTIILTCLLIVNPFYFFFGTVQNALNPISILFSVKYTPLYRSDMSTLQELKSYLQSQASGTIYVLASGGNLNSDILKSLNKPYQNNAISGLLATHDVDLRDGFPSEFLTASTVVTTSPIELHLAAGTQEVVRYLAEQIQDPNSYIGDNFKKDPTEFIIDNDRRVYIYHKISDFAKQDLEQMANYYQELYPDHPELFTDRILQD